MKNDLFYPIVKRKDIHIYFNRDGKFYSDYQSNYEKVSEDCLKRCVYCDATEKECGGDKFSLDHFRPRKIFASKFDGSLITHPYNLYLSCQKCNVLKSSDWHGCEKEINGYTFIGKVGYLDRFAHNYLEYLNIDENGYLISLNDSSPVDYMIQRLHLNRPNRVFLRQKRLLKIRAKELVDKIKKVGDDILFQYDNGQLQVEVALLKIRNMQRLQHMIMEFYDITP